MYGDLRQPALLSPLLREVDVVVHCAAVIGGTPHEIQEVNDKATTDLIECARARPVHRFVILSSVAVYGEGDLLDIVEDRSTDPVDAYGRSKCRIEELLRNRLTRWLYRLLRRTAWWRLKHDSYGLAADRWFYDRFLHQNLTLTYRP